MSYVPPVYAQSVLDFDRDDLKNCVISERTTGREVYRVETTNKLKTTSIYRADEEAPLAIIEHSDILPDKIVFSGKKPVNVSKWLKTPAFSSRPVTFEEGDVKYQWNQYQADRTVLTMKNYSEAIAWFQCSRPYIVDGEAHWGPA